MFFDKTDGELGKTITVVVAMKNRPEKQSEPYIRMGLSRLIASGAGCLKTGATTRNWSKLPCFASTVKVQLPVRP
jgi:hypothetical protein